jgi:hypothetical protein
VIASNEPVVSSALFLADAVVIRARTMLNTSNLMPMNLLRGNVTGGTYGVQARNK